MLRVLKELVRFVVTQRKYWLAPVLIVLAILIVLVLISLKAGPAAPFLYPLF
jgi:hypothetical protein